MILKTPTLSEVQDDYNIYSSIIFNSSNWAIISLMIYITVYKFANSKLS